jgi:hypothetical protein
MVSMKDTAAASIAYDGEALRDGTMDVRELAPALLAVGSLCERANKLLNENRASVTVRVRATEKGSFRILIELWQSLPDQVKEFLTGDGVTRANDILTFLGFVGGGVTTSVLAYLKWKKNRKVQREEQLADGGVRIEINNTFIDLRQEVYILANDLEIREEWGKTLIPLDRPGIDTFEVRSGSETVERVDKSEVEYIRPSEELEGEGQPAAHESTSEAALIVVKPALREGLKWDVARDSRSAKFSAEMKDTEFLERVRRHAETFGMGDVLVVDLRTRTFFTPQGGVRLEYEIVRVKRRLEPPTQRPLFEQP